MSKCGHGLPRQILAFAVASVIGVAGTAMAAVPAGGQFATLTNATQLSRGDAISGVVSLSQPLHVVVSLKLRNPAQLAAFNAKPHAPMSHAQLSATHLPTHDQAQAVADYLTRAGFRNVTIAPNRLLVSADGNAAAAQAAFQTSLVGVRTHDGRQAFVNSSPIRIPVALQGSVQAVLGLQNVHQMHILAHQLQPNATGGISGHRPTEFASIYGASSLSAATSVPVGIVSAGNMSPTLTDLNTFTTSNGLAAVTTNVVCVDYQGTTGAFSTTDPTCASSDTSGTVEWDLDSQDIVGITGGVQSLTFYAASSLQNSALTDTISKIVADNSVKVINVSLGECERYTDSGQGGDGSAQTDDALFQTAAAQGQTFSVSTGDSGSAECYDRQLNSASYPASSPWVVAASGTTLNASTGSSASWVRENVWIGAGGSPSSFEMAQPWQTNLTYGQYAGYRGPDIAFDANPNTGAIIVINGRLGQVGGTSLAAPLFAGAWARILQSNPSLGFAAPHLYALPRSALHDVTAGNNGGYFAKRGWDWATGLGSFNVEKAAAALGD